MSALFSTLLGCGSHVSLGGESSGSGQLRLVLSCGRFNGWSLGTFAVVLFPTDGAD
jgi:hypothetical protein